MKISNQSSDIGKKDITLINDIALLILNEEVTLDLFTSIACLPNKLAYQNLDNQVFAFNWNDLYKLSTYKSNSIISLYWQPCKCNE